jgi:hypothetical protein
MIPRSVRETRPSAETGVGVALGNPASGAISTGGWAKLDR